MRSGHLIDTVEASYRIADSETKWLAGVIDAASPGLLVGLGGIAAIYDRSAKPKEVLTSIVDRGLPSELLTAMRSAFENGDEAERDRSLRLGGPILELTKLAGGPLDQNPYYREISARTGCRDVVVVKAANPDGTGALLAAALRKPAPPAEYMRDWTRVGAHVAAGLRIMRAACRTEAVLDPGGRVVDAEGEAQSARTALREAAIRIDRARTRRRRHDDALGAWTALVHGRWSLVDHFESDGRRFVLALANPPRARDPRALTADERAVIAYAAMGHSNKLMAYALGIPEGTVASRLRLAMRKLGVRSRVELVERYHTLRDASTETISVGREQLVVARSAKSDVLASKLTAAELETARLATRGLTNEAIAEQRGCSVNTVANLLARVYRKLGIASRAELAAV